MVDSENYSNRLKNVTESNIRITVDHTLEHFRAIVQDSDDAIISKTLEGVVMSWNSGAQSIFGYTEREMVGRNILVLIPPNRVDEEAYFLRKMIDGDRIDHFETERLHKNGNRIGVSVTLSPIRDRAKKIVGVSKIARDITQHLKLYASSQIANAILMSTDDAIISKTLKGIVTSWNPAATQLFGYSEEEMLGHTLEILFPRGREHEEFFILERVANGERIDHFETVRVHKNGSPVHVSVSISPIHDAWGIVIGASKIARATSQRRLNELSLLNLNRELEEQVVDRTKDLSATSTALQNSYIELKRTQDELIRSEKMSALGVLIAGVSHEMNTPLGNSLTVCSGLHDEVTSFGSEVETGDITKTRLQEFNQQIHSGLDLLIRNLARAVEQIVHFKQVSIDQASDQRRAFELKSIVNDNVSVLRPQFRHTQHALVADIPNGIMMDSFPGAIGQVITNLVLNSLAHGFSDDMQGVVSISAKLEGSARLQLTITDNGRGIPKENLAKIFDPFFTTKTGQGGSGLGLNIVFNLVTLTLGGTISAESEVGGDTKFIIVIPLNIA